MFQASFPANGLPSDLPLFWARMERIVSQTWMPNQKFQDLIPIPTSARYQANLRAGEGYLQPRSDCPVGLRRM
eukprot:6191897-Karenia_brevis.AAC.1